MDRGILAPFFDTHTPFGVAGRLLEQKRRWEEQDEKQKATSLSLTETGHS